jgi:uncharacterized protein YegP (UPF0339 family)
MKRPPQFAIYRAADGWRWRLVAANGEIVAVGEAYRTRAGCRRAVATVRRLAAAASVVVPA